MTTKQSNPSIEKLKDWLKTKGIKSNHFLSMLMKEEAENPKIFLHKCKLFALNLSISSRIDQLNEIKFNLRKMLKYDASNFGITIAES